MQRGGHAAAAPPTIVMTCAVQKATAGQFHGVPSPAFAMRRAHAMGTDREIERLSEMPADSIAAATTKIGTSARPAGSSAGRLHHFRKHTEGGHGRSWHFSAVPTAQSNVRYQG